MSLNTGSILEMANAYTEAWCSRSAEAVASFYSENAISIINADEPAVGRDAIVEAMNQFIIALPDLVVRMDDLRNGGNQAIYLWTLVGTHRVTENFVKISGWQNWVLSDDLLIAKADGGYNAEDYERQINDESVAL